MTGAYLRVLREGKWQNIEVEFLTDDERREILQGDFRLIEWVNLLCHKIQEVDILLVNLEAGGIIERKVDIS